MTGVLIGFARISTAEYEIETQRVEPVRLGVAIERIYIDHTHRSGAVGSSSTLLPGSPSRPR